MIMNTITERQRVTILAALLYWQRNVVEDYGDDELAELGEWSLANSCGVALDTDSIDVLIERMGGIPAAKAVQS